jgi:DNA-directed RNA polymerase subunit RPC12/RpoP
MPESSCPKCGSKELGKGKHSGYATMYPVHKTLSMGSDVIYRVCTDCGYILEGYVQKPEKFKK